MKKIFITLFLLVSALLLTACGKPITISLSETDIELYIEETYEIKASALNIENPVFIYEILNDDGTIELDHNTITALKKGITVVEVGIKDQEKVEKVKLNITVKNISPTELTVQESVSLKTSETFKIEYSIKPDNSISVVTFKSNNESVATVSNDGIITAVSSGDAIITVIATGDENTVTKEIAVNVKGNSKPEFVLEENYKDNIVINWNDESQVISGIKVIDAEDGDITNSIKIVNSNAIREYGKQEVEISVKDSDGNEISMTRNIEVVWNYDVQFIGHAGSYFGLMNSEEAILYAIKQLKYQAVEIDVKQTKDGVFVLCHDDTFGDYTLASTNWADLKDVTVTQTRKSSSSYPVMYGDVKGSGKYTTKLCTLERYLEICKEYNVTAVIELKSSKGITNSDQSRMQALMNEIEKAEMLDNVIFLGSQYNCLIWTRNNGYDYIPCQYLVNSCESDTYLQRCIDNNLDISINVTASYSNSEEWLAKYHDAGLKVSTYTYSQYVDYSTVQEWIDKGVDFVTCDWHQMNKLKLPVSSNEPVKTFNVKFVDHDGTVLKESQVKQGKVAAAPKVNERLGYIFTGWDKDLKNIQSDMVFTAQYEKTVYSITYMSNVDKVTESTWASKDEFINEFYNDLFSWIKEKGTEIDGLTISGNAYTLKRNSTTVTFTSPADIKTINIFDFEKTVSNILYKPVVRNSDGTCVIVEDEAYFLNSTKYRVKYQAMDQWLYNCIKTTANYQSYDTTYKVLSSGKIQIFFRMQQWMQGTNIPAFNNLPKKYILEPDQTVSPVLPTTPITYTIEDEITLPVATGNVKFIGWYLTSDCSGEKVEKIKKGTTGNLVLYAKWEQ